MSAGRDIIIGMMMLIGTVSSSGVAAGAAPLALACNGPPL